jgi:phenylacetate-coenzyme A ligase PaaK-like adenylate-forming protein
LPGAGGNKMRLSRRLVVKGDFFKKYNLGSDYTNFSAADILTLQRRRLENIIGHACKHSDFYRELYKSYGINAANTSELQITDLPIVDKNLIMDNFDQVVCNKAIKKEDLSAFINDPAMYNQRFKGKYTVIHTSGSSGKTGIFVYDDMDMNAINILFVKYVFNVKPLLKMLPQRVAFLGAINGHYAAYTAISRYRDYFIKFLPVSVETTLDHVIRELNNFQPTILVAYSSMLYHIAGAQIDGKLHINPHAINTGGELLTPQQKTAAYEAFGVMPRSIYGASESVIIGAETAFNDGMYLFSDWNLMETLDDRDVPVASRAYGHAVLTNLYNYVLPLIRYRMDDVVSIDRNPISKKLPFEVIEEIEGRTEDFLQFNIDGNIIAIHPLVFVEFYVKGLRQIQVIKKREDYFIARISLNENHDGTIEAVRHRLQEILSHQQAIGKIGFDIELVEEIPNDPLTGKYKLVVNDTRSC